MLLYKRIVQNLLRSVVNGHIIWDDKTAVSYGDINSDYVATVTVHDPRFYRDFVLNGSLGAADAYIKHRWSCDDLTMLLKIITLNPATFNASEHSGTLMTQIMRRIKNILSRNTLKRSRDNILQHYDLGNDFFSLFLDDTKMYSCAEFSSPEQSLLEAQTQKLKKICDQLELNEDDHLCEIGSGWGSLALYAAKKTGCRVTTTTLSDAQYQYVCERVAEHNLQNKITVLKKDYRQLTGQFDKLVSIEMIEAVGHPYIQQYFSVCNDLLKTGGKFFLQTITINDAAYPAYKNDTDFIKAYIFPGGCLPSLKLITECTERTMLKKTHSHHIGQHYVKTLSCWAENFNRGIPTIKALGFNTDFIRTWQYYFSYCEAGFFSEYIDTLQLVFEKK